jgi:hypothetical protein
MLTVIAVALIYLCIVLTPMPSVSAQQPGQIVGAPQPGLSTGPAEVVIVGWRSSDTVPVAISRGEVRVSGRVEMQPASDSVFRMTVIGWEDHATPREAGTFHPIDEGQGRGLPVAAKSRTP